jgi:deoxyribodipyrimidine photo-lyase
VTALVWFRTDLRSLDHRALTSACAQHQQVRALYLLCPRQLDEHIIAPIRRQFLRRAIDELSRQLAELGIELDIIIAGHFSDVPAALITYCRQHQISEVYAHREWLVDEMQRDHSCTQVLTEELNIPLQLIDDSLLSPLSIAKNDGSPYRMFTPFSRRCRDQLQADFPRCQRRPKAIGSSVLAASCTLFGAESDSSLWPVREDLVLGKLKDFCAARAPDYIRDRDFPSLTGTSQLSAALALGLISPRQGLARLQQECGDMIWDAKSGAGCWLNELLWREFYRHVAYHFPQVVKGRVFQSPTEAIPWPNDRRLFEAWQLGQTGYPIVDAGMRQLAETGWMHNRLRMITASFLCKDLHIDWRWGERHFLENLIDADFASNNGGWQWAASTGTDAAPYFRIFNPTTQGQRFDAGADFIKHFVPELEHLPPKQCHQPHDVINYPKALVDHSEMRKITLALFQAIRD